jgi:hypothetical protein
VDPHAGSIQYREWAQSEIGIESPLPQLVNADLDQAKHALGAGAYERALEEGRLIGRTEAIGYTAKAIEKPNR